MLEERLVLWEGARFLRRFRREKKLTPIYAPSL
jgi:hypothetical protein